jgi:hypothetical protein
MCCCVQIKDAAERRKLDDRQLHALVTGASPTCVVLQPDLVYDYNSKYACSQATSGLMCMYRRRLLFDGMMSLFQQQSMPIRQLGVDTGQDQGFLSTMPACDHRAGLSTHQPPAAGVSLLCAFVCPAAMCLRMCTRLWCTALRSS